MTVNNLYIENFKNYDKELFNFSEKKNIIYGENAQGKTNLLESVFYLSGAKSFRPVRDKELIKSGKEYAVIKADTCYQDRKAEIRAEIFKNKRKNITVNGVKLKTSGELYGRLCMVLFTPDDLLLIRGGAAERRRYMDLAFSQLRPGYAAAAAKYARLHEHKTRILKDHKLKPGLLDTLEAFNEQIAVQGAIIIGYRARFLRKISAYCSKLHHAISGGKETLDISYKTVSTVDDPFADTETVYRHILSHMESHRDAEISTGTALSGPHKDDIEIIINGMSARTFASQGQTRTAALSMKLAEQELFYADRGEYPILLLDDVLSELDGFRREFVLSKIDRGQVFITLCDKQDMEGYDGKLFHILNGRKY